MEKGDKKRKIINQHKMVVKDAREVSYGMEADIEITTGKMKGLARAKIYGPSKSSTKKNRCTILIEKYPNPNSEVKFATILSRKIVKPLLDTYLKGLGWKNIMKNSTINITDRVQCLDCEKSFGKGYIKTHMVKMHKNKCSLCKKTFQKVYDLKNHEKNVHNKSENDIHKNAKQSEISITPKKVFNPGSEKEANSQNLKNLNRFSCIQCNIKFNTNMELSEHITKSHIHDNWPDSGSKRDASLVKTSSMVEPKKKKAAHETEMKERSDMMDKKILEKRKREEINNELEKKRHTEKKVQEEVLLELEKKRKMKEKERKTNNIEETKKSPNLSSDLPYNVSELPPEVRRMYDGSKEYHVPGDGACCLNCLAAWIYLNVQDGPALSRDLNTHIAENREYYKDKISFPLTITLAGGERRVFDIGEEDTFFDTLVASPDATYMWRGSEDLIAIANLTKMEVEVVVYDQQTKVVEMPTQQYKPDPNFPWKAEDVNALRDNHYKKLD